MEATLYIHIAKAATAAGPAAACSRMRGFGGTLGVNELALDARCMR